MEDSLQHKNRTEEKESPPLGGSQSPNPTEDTTTRNEWSKCGDSPHKVNSHSDTFSTPKEGTLSKCVFIENMEILTNPQQKDTCKAFSRADMLRMRIHLLEIIEEVKFRRLNDKEAEERIKNLITENHELNLKYENSVEEVHRINDIKESSLASLKKEHQNKIANMEATQHTLQITIDNYMKECRRLKDEIQGLQMANYNMEKDVKEQETRLQLRDSLRETTMAQVTALGKKCTDIIKKMEELSEDYSKLDKNVKEACKLNNQLNYIVDHHNCEIKWYKSQISALQEALTKANVELSKKPQHEGEELREIKHANKKLKQELEVSEAIVQRLETYLKQNKEQLEITESQLKTSSELVARHAKHISHKTEEVIKLQLSLAQLTKSHAELNMLYNERSKEIEVEREEHAEKQQEWIKQKDAMKKELSTVKREYQSLVDAYNNLEELNTKWASKNMALTKEIKMLKEQLFKAKSDQETQTCADIQVATVQTEVLFTTSVCIQTTLFNTCIAAVQTESTFLDNTACAYKSVPTASEDEVSAVRQKPTEKCAYTVNLQVCDTTIHNTEEKQHFQFKNKPSDKHAAEYLQPMLNALGLPNVQMNKVPILQTIHENDEISSYNKFTCTLKTMTSMLTMGHSGKSRSVDEGRSIKKRKMLESQSPPAGISGKHVLKLGHASTESKQCVVGKDTTVVELSEEIHSAAEKHPSILINSDRMHKKSKQVSFCEQLQYHIIPSSSHPSCPSVSETTLFEEKTECSSTSEDQIEEVIKYLDTDQLSQNERLSIQ